MCVCVYVCVCAYVRVYIYDTCIYMYMYGDMCMHMCMHIMCMHMYIYDGPRQPNGDFLENLKITENLRISRFFGLCGNYGKITEKLPKITEIKQQIRKKYKIRRFPVIFRNFRIFFSDFENSEFGIFFLIFR